MEIVIVTGLSGAGKSRAINAFEDIGFFCVDNLPPKLIVKFAELCKHSIDDIDKVAIVVDARGGSFLSSIFDTLKELKDNDFSYKVLFLDAQDDVIVRRYKETRRRHHLYGQAGYSLEKCVELEREKMQSLREIADYIIDTSILSPAKLRERINQIFLVDTAKAMQVYCTSFGFKYGKPIESDLVFDVRCLKNPFYVDELKYQTGLDEPVREYVMREQTTKEFLQHLFDMIDFSLPLYNEEGKSQLIISIGCTGGRHRSVAITEALANHLKEKGYRVATEHRDITKGLKSKQQ